MLALMVEITKSQLPFLEKIELLIRLPKIRSITALGVTLGCCQIIVWDSMPRVLKQFYYQRTAHLLRRNGYFDFYGTGKYCKTFSSVGLSPIYLRRQMTIKQVCHAITLLMQNKKTENLSVGILTDYIDSQTEDLVKFLAEFTSYLFIISKDRGEKISARLLEETGVSIVVSESPSRSKPLQLVINLQHNQPPFGFGKALIFDLSGNFIPSAGEYLLQSIFYKIPADILNEIPYTISHQDFLRLLCQLGEIDITRFSIDGFLCQNNYLTLLQIGKKLFT